MNCTAADHLRTWASHFSFPVCSEYLSSFICCNNHNLVQCIVHSYHNMCCLQSILLGYINIALTYMNISMRIYSPQLQMHGSYHGSAWDALLESITPSAITVRQKCILNFILTTRHRIIKIFS